MKQHIAYLGLLLACGGTALAMEQQPEESVVKRLGNTLATGEVITSQTLPALAAKYSPMSQEDDEKVKRWLANADNLRLLAQLTQIPKERTYESVVTDMRKTGQAFKESGIKNISRWNYVWQLDPEDPNSPIAKVSGKRAIIFGLVGSQHSPHDWIREKKETEGEKAFSTFPFEKTNEVRTHQTTSRMAHWLRARERAGKRFVISAEHLAHIPGQGTEEHDENYFIVEKPLRNARPLNTLSDDEEKLFWSTVSQETLTEACEVIAYAGLWCVGGNLMAFKDDNGVLVTDVLAYADFEQPDNSRPQDFFYQNDKKYVGDALNGIGELCGQIAKHAPEQIPVFKKSWKTVLDERYPAFKQAIIDAGRENDIKDLYE
jgi:hypothetical protein